MIKKSIVSILVFFGLIQLIRPKQTDYMSLNKNDFLTNEKTEKQIKNLVTKTCYNCHSNNINSKWYYKITPVNFWVKNTTKKDTKKPNLSNWRLQNTKQKINLLDDFLNVLEKKTTSSNNEILAHKDFKISEKEIKKLKNWLLILKIKYDLEDLPM